MTAVGGATVIREFGTTYIFVNATMFTSNDAVLPFHVASLVKRVDAQRDRVITKLPANQGVMNLQESVTFLKISINRRLEGRSVCLGPDFS